jgi:hypothetical protein
MEAFQRRLPVGCFLVALALVAGGGASVTGTVRSERAEPSSQKISVKISAKKIFTMSRIASKRACQHRVGALCGHPSIVEAT